MKYFAILENDEVVGIVADDSMPQDDRQLVELAQDSIVPASSLTAKMVLKGDRVIWQEPDLPAAIRTRRDKLLQETDWVVLRALESGQLSSEWTTYRQILRDLPQHPDFPLVDFPEMPKA